MAKWDDRQGWLCTCGRSILGPRDLAQAGAVKTCANCGRRYRFDYWSLSRWYGDSESMDLEPRADLRGGVIYAVGEHELAEALAELGLAPTPLPTPPCEIQARGARWTITIEEVDSSDLRGDDLPARYVLRRQ